MNNSRILWMLLAAASSTVFYLAALRSDPRVDALNQAIEANASAELKRYPYAFRVWRLEGATAVMGTPRSPAMPVIRMIRAIDPSLSGKGADDPDFVAAEKQLAKVQSEARQIVLAQPGVSDVKWELDRDWLINRQISLD